MSASRKIEISFNMTKLVNPGYLEGFKSVVESLMSDEDTALLRVVMHSSVATCGQVKKAKILSTIDGLFEVYNQSEGV